MYFIELIYSKSFRENTSVVDADITRITDRNFGTTIKSDVSKEGAGMT